MPDFYDTKGKRLTKAKLEALDNPRWKLKDGKTTLMTEAEVAALQPSENDIRNDKRNAARQKVEASRRKRDIQQAFADDVITKEERDLLLED